jgi:hypothetical protein
MNIPLDEWSGAKATKELHETVKKIERANIRLQRWMLLVTILTLIVGIIALWPIVKG